MRPAGRAAATIALVVAAHAGAALAAVSPLRPFLDTTVRGGLAAAATCVNHAAPADGGPTGGVLRLDSVPAGASVVHAFLYWSVLSDTVPVDTGIPTLDGTPILPATLGTVPRTPCLTQDFTATFRADVTRLVAGNGSYRLTGLPGTGTMFGTLTEGATLLVVWCNDDAPPADVIVLDGIDAIVDAATSFTQRIDGFQADAAGVSAARLVAVVGNGQNRDPGEPDTDPFIFNGVDLDATQPAILSGALCPPDGLYDLTSLDVSGLVPAGSTSATLEVRAQGDCYSFAAVALAVTTDPATKVAPCTAPSCGGATVLPPAVSCGDAPVDVAMGAVITGCPAGPVELANQATDPLTVANGVVESDMLPPVVSTAATAATLSFELGGETDVLDCAEVSLVDPAGTATVVKPAGAPSAGRHDVSPAFTGSGTYRVRLGEVAACGITDMSTAVLARATLRIDAALAGPTAEYRLEHGDGRPICDWSTAAICPATPDCPGEALVVRGRCLHGPSCERQAAVQVQCSDVHAVMTWSTECGSAQACFEDKSTGGIGTLTRQWDFAGEAMSSDATPCHTFGAPPPWDVRLVVTDEADCTSEARESVAPPAGPDPIEPSALDLRPAAPPLLVSKSAAGLELSWEDLGPALHHDVLRGVIGDFASHGPVGGACGVVAASATLPMLAGGSHYFVVLGFSCDGRRSSAGRDSFSRDRASGTPCP